MNASRSLTETSPLSLVAASYLANCEARTRTSRSSEARPKEKRDRAPLAESTVQRYRSGLADLGQLADLPVGEIRHSQVLVWHDELADEKGIAHADVSAIFLRALFSWARRRDLCRDNPAARMRLEHRSAPRIPLTLDQTQALWDKLEARLAAHVFRWSRRMPQAPKVALTSTIDCLRLLLLTAARRGELAKTRCEHVQLSERRIVVPRAKHHPRVIALGPAAIEVVRERLPEVRRVSDYLFPSPRDSQRSIAPASVWEQVKVISGELKLPGLTLHTLRTSFATWARSSGFPLRVIGEFLGHEDLRTTKRFYTVYAVDPASAQLAAAYDGAVRVSRGEGPHG